MRTFIAIELSDDIKNTLAQAQSHLKYAGVLRPCSGRRPEFLSRDGADVKWVKKDNIHLTLKFLGEIDENKCEKVKAALDEIVKSTPPFDLSVKDIGVFPNVEFPRVVWIGLDKGAKESTEIAGKVDEAMSKLGFEREKRPFAAHLTIGRVRSSKNKEALKDKIFSYTLHPIPYIQRITCVTLYQSTLTPKGSIYTKLHEAKLGTAPIYP